MVDIVLFSSAREDWETPQKLYDLLNSEFRFTLDPASSATNHKVAKYYTVKDDGLGKDWSNERIFCNPPYGKLIYQWVEKLASGEADVAVGLLSARTDTRWFHSFIYNRAEIRFIKGRIKFVGAKNVAPFPSMICIWRKDA